MGVSSTNTWTRTEDIMRIILVAAVCLTTVAFVSSAPYHPYSWPTYHYSLPTHYTSVSLVAHPNGALVPLDVPAVLHAKQLHAALGGAVHHAAAFSPIVTKHEDLPEPVAAVQNVVAADPHDLWNEDLPEPVAAVKNVVAADPDLENLFGSEEPGTEPVEVEEDLIDIDQIINLRTDDDYSN